MKKAVPLLLLFITLTCQISFAQSEQVLSSLKKELLSHYSKDPTKYKIAEFIVNNIKFHGSVYSDKANEYYSKISQINSSFKYPSCKDEIYKLYNNTGFQNTESGVYTYDVDRLTAKYLIQQIDQAYSTWKSSTWAQHLTLSDFCEYILPYRIGNENIENWRDSLKKQYLNKIDWIKQVDEKKNSAFWAATYLNDQIKSKGFHIDGVYHINNVDLPYQALSNIRMGECSDYAEYTTMVMRACGIPVAIDFTPQWPFRSSGHYWNTLLDNSGKNIPFMGGESNPGYPCKAGYVMAKVLRKTYAFQANSLFNKNLAIKEAVPDILNSPFIRDVSCEYFKGVDVDVTLPLNIQKNSHHFLYLSVFNNQEWVPITYTEKGNGNIIHFSSMGTGIVYLPVYWGEIGAIGFSNPILVKSNGEVETLKPDFTHKQTVTLNRKFPKFEGVLSYSNRIVGGHFEGANNSDFNDAINCGTIVKNPQMCYDSISCSISKACRFWRYCSPKDKGHANIAEIHFFYKNKEVLPVNYLSDGKNGEGYEPQMAFDHDELTFYQSSVKGGAWIGVDFGKAVKIDKIIYLPRNDDNNVVPGHIYRLDYYKDGKTVGSSEQVSTGYSISFHNMPSNALFILHDLTKGKEERIFTYQNNSVNWY